MSSLNEIYLSKDQKGNPIIALEPEGYHIKIEEKGRNIGIKLDDFLNPKRKTSPWITIDRFDKIDTSRACRTIKELLKERYQENYVAAISTIIQLFQDNKEYFLIEDEYTSNALKYFTDEGFIPEILSSEILAENQIFTQRDTDESFIYDPLQGYYLEHGNTYIIEKAKKKLGEFSKRLYLKEVETDIKAKTYIDTDVLIPKPHLINMRNGVFNLETRELEPHNPDYYFTSRLEIYYDPDAKCPEILKFLEEICPEHATDLVQFAGYCLYKDYPIHVFFILEGKGRNGKTTFVRFIIIFLGEKNVSSIPMQELENSFKRGHIKGKLANISDDLPKQALYLTGSLKKLTGNSPIDAEHKFAPPFEFVNYAKMLFTCNEIPRTSDQTDAFWERAIPIEFKNQFKGDKNDSKKIDKLTTDEELSGFFNLAIDGLQILLSEGQFMNVDPVEERRAKYIRLSDPIQFFAETYLVMDVKNMITSADLYTTYTNQCALMEKIPVDHKIFSNTIRRYLPYVRDTNRKLGTGELYYTKDGYEAEKTKSTRVWVGIKIRIPDTQDTQDTLVSQIFSNIEDLLKNTERGNINI